MPTLPKERTFTLADGLNVRVVRSARRTRTVSAAWSDGTALVSVPARLSLAQEDEWVTEMVGRLRSGRERAGRRNRPKSDAELMLRARQLSDELLDGRAVPTSVRWVTNQNKRWGSATPADGSIRLSHKLQPMPSWVQDFVLTHELAHLAAPGGHGPQFKALEARYPRRLEAEAFLAGVSFGMNRPADGTTPEDAPSLTDDED